MGYTNGDEIRAGIKVGNGSKIVEFPEREFYYYLYYQGDKKDKYFNVELQEVGMPDLRHNFRARRVDMPIVQGDWENVQYWVHSMWDAMWNPIWLLKFPRLNRGRKWAVIAGQHRLRLMDALDASHLYVYMCEYPEYGQFDWRITRQDIKSSRVIELMDRNHLPPRRGTITGVCQACEKKTSWRKKTGRNKLTDVKMFCKRCGAENPYPYPGML